MRVFAILTSGLACALSVGCGSVGEPLYPAVNIPTRVSDLSAVERGDHIDIVFTIPPLTTEGLAIKTIGSVEVRVGPNTAPDFQIARWAAAAKRVDVPAGTHPGPLNISEPAQPFIGQDVIVAVRLGNAKGRFSDWSNLATFHVEQPLAKPSGFKAEADPQGVSLTWSSPGVNQFRLYRKAGEEKQPTLLNTFEEPSYLDTTAEFGKPYEYYVEAFHEKAVSETAGPASITLQDIFPPAVPTGVSASAGLGSIELAWERNTERDFKEYRVLRAEGSGAFSQISAGIEAPSYSDHNVESGKLYRYRIVAVDQSGNASEPSNPVEATAP